MKTPRLARFFLACLLLALPLYAAAQAALEPPAAAAADQAQMALLREAVQRMREGKPAEAVEVLDRLVAVYEARVRDGGARIYEARMATEGTLYMVQAELRHEKAALVVGSGGGLWGEAYYIKGYALIDLGQLDAAQAALERAIAVAPRNAKYLGELGHIQQTHKDWPAALATFGLAETSARDFSPDPVRVREWTRALRGSGYALIETGRLDEAEGKYQMCLELDRGDQRAMQELGYLRDLRAKQATPK